MIVSCFSCGRIFDSSDVHDFFDHFHSEVCGMWFCKDCIDKAAQKWKET